MVSFQTRQINSKRRGKNIKWKDWRWWLKKAGIALGILIVLGIVGTVSIFIYFSRDLPSDEELRSVEDAAESTKIYDRTGEIILYEVHGEENRTWISIDEIPEDLINATLAVEDSNFYEHNGVHFKSLIRAFFANLGGGVNQGGSTITQQLIKNTLLTSERSISRKVKEAILAVRLEQKYTKDEILEMYLNTIPYGNNAYGTEAASQTYYGKNAKDMSLAESSILSGLPNRPTYLNPYGDHRNDLYIRQEHILNRMKDLDMVSEEEKDEAMNLSITDDFFQPIEKHTTIKAPHFVFYIKDQLEEIAKEEGLEPHVLETGGYQVTTTLDYELQEKAERIVTEYSAKNEDYNINNMAMAAIEPDTGHIISMVGSRDWRNDEIDGKVNVTLRDRQPGSSFKPYVYATAFKNGFNPNTIIYDVKTNFGNDGSGKDYVPNNYDYSFRGPVSMQDAMIKSLNIPAVKTFHLSGSKEVMQTAYDMGLSHIDPNETYGLSSALGTQEVKLLDHLGALSVFGNEGEKADKISILKIEGKDGEVLLDKTEKSRGKRVLDENVANMMNSSISSRTSGTLFIPGHKVAAKTGTSTKIVDGKSRPSNTWTFGWTNEISAGFWAGNNDGSALSSSAVSTRNAAPAWQAFMKEALNKYPKSNFSPPRIEESDVSMVNGDHQAGEKATVCKYEGKLAKENTPSSQIQEATFGGAHSLLYYVNPSDSLLSNWEKGVIAWTKGISLGDVGDINSEDVVPSEYCVVHDEVNQPKIEIVDPTDGKEVEDEETIIITVVSTSPLSSIYDDISINRVEFYINNEKVETQTETSGANTFVYEANIADLSGEVDILIKSFDNIDNMASKSISIMVSQTGDDPEEGEEGEEEESAP